MSEMSMLPVPVIQMGLVEKLVEVAQNQPHVQQLVAQELARQAAKAQTEQVPQVDASERGKKIRDRESGQKKREQRHASGQSSGDHNTDELGQESAEDGPHTDNPWAGQIVNMKV